MCSMAVRDRAFRTISKYSDEFMRHCDVTYQKYWPTSIGQMRKEETKFTLEMGNIFR